MKRLKQFGLVAIATVGLLSSCTSEKVVKEQVEKVIKDNPQIVLKAIEKDPVAFVEALQKAVTASKAEMAKKREEEEKRKFEESFNNPLKPEIRADEAIRGTKGAPLTLVEYSDFECPYCSKGYETMTQLLEKYKGKIAFVYKHQPLSFHQNALPAARYYEAIRLQSHDMAFKFHDEIFKDISKLRKGEGFLKALAKKVGANMGRLSKDVNSEAVNKRIAADMAEAKKFEMHGTPGFLINGIPVRGAYPARHFVQIIEELKKRGKVKL
jgi:protein-disulfide isomerase